MRLFAGFLLFSALVAAQSSEVSAERAGGLPGVKVSGLSNSQKAQVLSVARQQSPCNLRPLPDENCTLPGAGSEVAW